MTASARKAELNDVQALRALFLQENNFQIRYNAHHERHWTDSYLLSVDDLEVGYGSIKGGQVEDRDTVFEFYVVPPFRNRASELFRKLVVGCRAQYIECQTNDSLLSSMLYEFSTCIAADIMLFEDHSVTRHRVPGALFRPRQAGDSVFRHRIEPVGDYVIELNGQVAATGGFMLHYNHPFADLYMEVSEAFRGRGLGGYLVQELKRECYLHGRVPAARCDIRNIASRKTLIKAGLRTCGFIATGKIPVDHL